MNKVNGEDFINVYILNTLNEIKIAIKKNALLEKEQELKTDKKWLLY